MKGKKRKYLWLGATLVVFFIFAGLLVHRWWFSVYYIHLTPSPENIGAEVYIDHKFFGRLTTTADILVKNGRREICVVKQEYKPYCTSTEREEYIYVELVPNKDVSKTNIPSKK